MIKKILYWLAIILLIGGFIYFGTKDYKTEEKFNMNDIYNKVNKDNVYKEARSAKVLNIIENGSGIILFAFPENKYANNYASIINDVAKNNNIKEIYYYDFYKDRIGNRKNYEQIVKQLKKYLVIEDSGKLNIYSPSLLVIKDNNILFYDTEYNFMNSEIDVDNYFTNDIISTKKDNIDIIFKQYLR